MISAAIWFLLGVLVGLTSGFLWGAAVSTGERYGLSFVRWVLGNEQAMERIVRFFAWLGQTWDRLFPAEVSYLPPPRPKKPDGRARPHSATKTDFSVNACERTGGHCACRQCCWCGVWRIQ